MPIIEPQHRRMKIETTTSTSTFRFDRKEIERKIIEEARELARKKWWQDKKYSIRRITTLADMLNSEPLP